MPSQFCIDDKHLFTFMTFETACHMNILYMTFELCILDERYITSMTLETACYMNILYMSLQFCNVDQCLFTFMTFETACYMIIIYMPFQICIVDKRLFTLMTFESVCYMHVFILPQFCVVADCLITFFTPNFEFVNLIFFTCLKNLLVPIFAINNINFLLQINKLFVAACFLLFICFSIYFL